MKWALFLLLVPLTVWPVFGADGTTLDVPKENQPWLHAGSGLRFPAKLGKQLTCTEIFRFTDEKLGSRLRYANEKAGFRGDVYVYPCTLPAGSAAERQIAAQEAAGAAIWEIEEMQRRGHYANVVRHDATYQEIDLFPTGSGTTCLIEMPLELHSVEDVGGAKVEQALKGYLGVMMHHGHYVKIRCTYPASAGTQAEDLQNDLIKGVRRCVLDPGLRVLALQQIADYRQDPLSATGRDLAGGVLAYAEVTPLLNFTITDSIVTLGDEIQNTVKEASLDFTRAYIVGVVAAALAQPPPAELDLPHAGAAEVLRVFARLQQAHPGLDSPRLRSLATAVEQRKATEWFQAHETPASKQ